MFSGRIVEERRFTAAVGRARLDFLAEADVHLRFGARLTI